MATERGSSADRFSRELSGIHDDLQAKLVDHFNGSTVVDFSFLSRYLSLVRDQGLTGACSYVQTIACTEMIYRICRNVSNQPGSLHYFNIQDCFDHLYKRCPRVMDLPEAQDKLHNTMGGKGTNVVYVLQYIHKIGLLSKSVCRNPQERDVEAEFVDTPNRKKIDWHAKLDRDEVIPVLDKYPVIGVIESYKSFKACTEVVYDGPTDAERAIVGPRERSHTVLLVGKFVLKREDGSVQQYVVCQNSYGGRVGYRGYVALKLDELFVSFFIPMLSPQMDDLIQRKKARQSARELQEKAQQSARGTKRKEPSVA